MSSNANPFKSSLGKKYIMAVSGALLFLFVVGHLVGNLQIFLGPEAINRYGHFLQSNVEFLWPVRIGLLVLVGLHIWSAIQLSLENKAARPVGYAGRSRGAGSELRVADDADERTDHRRVHHLPPAALHRAGAGNQSTGKDFLALHDEKGRHDVYAMMVLGFQQPLVSGFYVVAMALLCLHLSHGVYAMFQSLGIKVGCCPCLPKCLREVGRDNDFCRLRFHSGGRLGRIGQKSRQQNFEQCPPPLERRPQSNMSLDARIPSGPLAQKWDKHKFESKLVNPANKRKFEVIVVGTGLAGASAAASLAELGYKVKAFCFQDSPRRAHSIAAQGGINAAKNYQNDGDSVYRLFYDTIKGGDFRAREANVYRLAQVSVNIIDQCVAQGVPFAREYGGLLANRSFGGAQVSRTFYARGQTGQQLLLGAYQALCRQIGLGNVQMFPRTEMLDLVVVDGHAKGIVVRDLVTGEISSHAGDAVVLATGGYGNVFFLSTNAKGCNVTAT